MERCAVSMEGRVIGRFDDIDEAKAYGKKVARRHNKNVHLRCGEGSEG